MVQFCSYHLDMIEGCLASQAVCRGFDSLRPLQSRHQVGRGCNRARLAECRRAPITFRGKNGPD
jgi:hypothetical protein